MSATTLPPVPRSRSRTAAEWRIGVLMRRLRCPFRQVLPSDATMAEALVCRIGSVEIRRQPDLWSLETCVKGDVSAARDAGLLRLAANGAGQGCLRTARPLMLTHEAANRWRLRVPLAAVDSRLIAAAPATGRVRLRAVPAETLAVMRVHGRPTPSTVADADACLRQILAQTAWITTGTAIVRLHAPPAILPWLSRSDVAVTVTAAPAP